jgi:hypothetical protein
MSNKWLENENFTRTTAIMTLFRCGNLSIILLQICVTYKKKKKDFFLNAVTELVISVMRLSWFWI